jgi:hypothetical protein
MRIADVEISPSAASFLALLLDRANQSDLALRVGLAVDANSSRGVPIRPDEREIVLAVLGDSPASELRALSDALSRTTRAQDGARASGVSPEGRPASVVASGGGS